MATTEVRRGTEPKFIPSDITIRLSSVPSGGTGGSRQGMGEKEDSWATGDSEAGYRRNSPDGMLKRREDGNEGW